MIDTHTHIYLREDFPEESDGGCRGAAQRAIDAGISYMVLPNVDIASCEQVIALHEAFPEATGVAAGLHPSEVGPQWREDIREIFDRFADTELRAVGEIGIDLYTDNTWRTRQMDAFGEQLQIAVERRLPVIIHCREGVAETLDVLRHFTEQELPDVVFHSFTATPDDARTILSQREVMFGFNGVITFKNAPLVREAARCVGIDRIMLETDAPWLAPVPLRGRRNESAYIREVCKKVAEECSLTFEQAEAITDSNAARFFRLNQPESA